jgi:hypothetical protein
LKYLRLFSLEDNSGMTDAFNWQHQEELKTVSQGPANICTNKNKLQSTSCLGKSFHCKTMTRNQQNKLLHGTLRKGCKISFPPDKTGHFRQFLNE